MKIVINNDIIAKNDFVGFGLKSGFSGGVGYGTGNGSNISGCPCCSVGSIKTFSDGANLNASIITVLKIKVIRDIVFKFVYEINRSKYKHLKTKRGEDLIRDQSLIEMIRYGRSDLFFEYVTEVIDLLPVDNSLLLRCAFETGNITIAKYLVEKDHIIKLDDVNTFKLQRQLIRHGDLDLFRFFMRIYHPTFRHCINALETALESQMLPFIYSIIEHITICFPDDIKQRKIYLKTFDNLGYDTIEAFEITKLLMEWLTLDDMNYIDIIMRSFKFGNMTMLNYIVDNKLCRYLKDYEYVSMMASHHGPALLQFLYENWSDVVFPSRTINHIIERCDFASFKYVISQKYSGHVQEISLQRALLSPSLEIADFILTNFPTVNYTIDDIHPSIVSKELIERLKSSPSCRCYFRDLLSTLIDNDLNDLFNYVDQMQTLDRTRIDFNGALKSATFKCNRNIAKHIIETNPGYIFTIPIPTCENDVIVDGPTYIEIIETILATANVNTINIPLNSIFHGNLLSIYPFLTRIIYILHSFGHLNSRDNSVLMDIVTSHGSLEIFQYLHKECNVSVSYLTLERACQYQHFHIIEYILTNRLVMNVSSAFDSIVRGNRLDLLIYLHKNYQLENYNILHAHNHPEILQYLLEHLPKSINIYKSIEYSMRGEVEHLQYFEIAFAHLVENKKNQQLQSSFNILHGTICNAAMQNQYSILIIGFEYQLFHTSLLKYLIPIVLQHGHIHLIKYFQLKKSESQIKLQLESSF